MLISVVKGSGRSPAIRAPAPKPAWRPTSQNAKLTLGDDMDDRLFLNIFSFVLLFRFFPPAERTNDVIVGSDQLMEI